MGLLSSFTLSNYHFIYEQKAHELICKVTVPLLKINIQTLKTNDIPAARQQLQTEIHRKCCQVS